MCIRDRYAPEPDCFDADGWGYQDESITVRAEEIRRYDTDITVVRVTVKDPSPVSYTHLDVYKRQTSGWPKLLSRKRGENYFCDTLERWQELKEQTAP